MKSIDIYLGRYYLIHGTRRQTEIVKPLTWNANTLELEFEDGRRETWPQQDELPLHELDAKLLRSTIKQLEARLATLQKRMRVYLLANDQYHKEHTAGVQVYG